MVSAFILCLSLNVYHEARGESELAQEAVALVTLNRMKGEGHTDTCRVVKAPGQFSWTKWGLHKGVVTKAGKPRNKQAWEKAKRVSTKATTAFDFTGGATHFHHVKVRPKWAKKMQYLGRYGNHYFYKEKKNGKNFVEKN